MRAITEERAGTDMVFRVSVPANKADAVRRHLESMMMLLGESVVTIGAPEETPDLPPGPMLKKLRKERGLSQKSLAEQLGTNQVRVSDMEQGVRPITPEFATKLAAVFGVSARFFLVLASGKSENDGTEKPRRQAPGGAFLGRSVLQKHYCLALRSSRATRSSIRRMSSLLGGVGASGWARSRSLPEKISLISSLFVSVSSVAVLRRE